MASTTQPKFIANRYEIRDVVGRGGMGIVYRCFDHVTRTEVALKQMLVDMKQGSGDTDDLTPGHNASGDTKGMDTIDVASPDTWRRDSPFIGMVKSDESGPGALRLALSHEFETLARLRHPNIITVLDYGFDALRLPFFTMPLLQSPQSITDAAKEAPLEKRIAWLADILQALAYLHHHKIIHRDLKPDNALLIEDGGVKVLDFGLAVIRERTESFQDNEESMVSGTIPYMAPELIQSAAPSTSSDLYAFGMIAYELLAGHYPFDFNGIADLIMRMLTEMPPIKDLDLAEPLQEWLENLLQTEKDKRASDALDVLKRLTEITDVQIPIETKTIQESYLQTARFVGRDEEMSALLEGLRSTLSKQGNSWLIVGEDGVGKSRLVSELRILALVNGFNVLQGHGSQGNLTPYQILREPVKRLLLSTPVDATEANVLKTLLPDLETILGRSVPEVVQDEVSKYGSQLSSVILNLFQQQDLPTLLILDDLHFAPESIDILSNLLATVSRSRLMIVATTRPDNATDTHTDLAEMTRIPLQRLADKDLVTLAKSILGDVALRADVQEVLKREAQGNVNFLLEVIRALLEEVQQLRDIAMMRLPQEITAGGINRVLAQRLTKISDEDQALFNLLATAGLEIDLQLLKYFADAKEMSDETWLTTLANNGIIERESEKWEIAHERLRVVALEQIDKDDLPHLHTQLAEALEALYPDALEKAGRIAYHWRQADNDERERPYLIDAADYALRLNSFQDAVRLYRRVLELESDERSDIALIQIKLGESLMYLGDYSEALDYVRQGLDVLDDSQDSERARALALLADLFWRTGKFDEGQSYANQALDLARKTSASEVEIRSLSRLGILSFEKGDYTNAEEFYQKGLALAEEHSDDVGLTMLNNNYGILAATQGDLNKAREHFQDSLEFSERHEWTYRMASSLINLGSIAGMQGDLDSAGSYFERALVMARSVGDRRSMAESLDNLGTLAQMRKEYRSALQYFEESLVLAETIGNRAAIPVLMRNLALVFEQLGNFETTQDYLMRAIQQANEIQAIPVSLVALADMARIESDAEQAVQWASFILDNDAARKEANNIATGVIEKWSKKLDKDTLEKYKESAADLTLETLLD